MKSRSRTDRSFLVPVQEIRDNKYDLSINRYKEVVYAEKTYASAAEIIREIEGLDAERAVRLLVTVFWKSTILRRRRR